MNAPWYIAGDGQSSSLGVNNTIHGVPGFNDAQHDVLLALMAWVENGTAPEVLIATKYVNDMAPGPDKVLRQRPLCVYPKRAVYTGEGDVDRPESWDCRALY